MMSENLNEAFFEYVNYLIFMAAQLPWGYGSFALIMALGKIVDLKALSNELGYDDLCKIIKEELDAVEGTPSSDEDTWKSLLDKLIIILLNEMKTNTKPI
jgi:hypothetical protein